MEGPCVSLMSEAPQTPAKPKLPWFWIMPIPVALLIGIIIGMQIPTPGDSVAAAPAPTAQAGEERAEHRSRAAEDQRRTPRSQ